MRFWGAMIKSTGRRVVRASATGNGKVIPLKECTILTSCFVNTVFAHDSIFWILRRNLVMEKQLASRACGLDD